MDNLQHCSLHLQLLTLFFLLYLMPWMVWLFVLLLFVLRVQLVHLELIFSVGSACVLLFTMLCTSLSHVARCLGTNLVDPQLLLLIGLVPLIGELLTKLFWLQ